MKKFISILLLFCTLTLCLASCGGNNNNRNESNEPTAVDNVISLISAISSAEDCLNAEKAYNALNESEKAQVSNYDLLISKKETYKDDLFLIELTEAARIVMKDHEDSVRNGQKNPNSFICNEISGMIYYNYSRNEYYLRTELDYSSQNSFGGYVRNDSVTIRYWDSKTNEWTGFWEHPEFNTNPDEIDEIIDDLNFSFSTPYTKKVTFTYDKITLN